ncbi:hypothetical protein JYK22_12370, partial [Nonomuraea sp. RK-328]|nr:hypothetical protein [Nonomuraea sp. RK-328]
MLRKSMRSLVAAAAIATALTGAGVAIVPAAEAAVAFNCLPAIGTTDGHVVNGFCYSGPGTRYWVVAPFCTPSGCSNLGGPQAVYGRSSIINAGSTAFWNLKYRYCANNGQCTPWAG